MNIKHVWVKCGSGVFGRVPTFHPCADLSSDAMVAIKSKASFQPSGEAAAKIAKRTGTPTDLERVTEAIRDGAVPCP